MPTAQQTDAALWNEFFLSCVAQSNLSPTICARAMAIAHTAIFDAWAAFDPVAVGVNSRIEAPESLLGEATYQPALEEAIAYAAYAAAKVVFPARSEAIDAFMVQMGYDPAAVSTDPDSPSAIGTAAAKAVLEYRASDFSNAEHGFANTTDYVPVNSGVPGADNAVGGPDFDPNHWQPLQVPTGKYVKLKISGDPSVAITPEPAITSDPASYKIQSPLTPQWAEVKAFSLDANYEFRPHAPPQLGDFSEYVDGNGKVTTGDAAYREQVAEVIAYSANLTDEQKAIAEFWADGPRSETPPGHWNQLAQDVSVRDGNTLEQDIQMFFALNNALLDTAIATWETKYYYDFIRPDSAIHLLYQDQTITAWLGPDKGSGEMLGQDWKPYQQATFVTPPFPEFTSGHSGFSMASATILQNFTGSDVFFDGVSQGSHDLNNDGELDLAGQYIITKLAFEAYSGPPIALTWETFSEAATEAGISRLYGGIHFQDGNLFGRELGANVGTSAWDMAQKYITGDAGALLQSPVGTADNDLLIGSTAGETFDAGDGNDVVRPNGGGDVVTLGAGADRIEGYAAALDGLVVKDFSFDDSIVILDGTDVATISVNATATSLVIAFGGEEITLEGVFAASQVIAQEVGSKTILTLSPPPGLIAGLGETSVLSAGSAARLSVVQELDLAVGTIIA
ncbi:MAG: phosphatase PAP2 family protein [Novosphingobium sp.]|nr:phosphatase PAP2 family protein [Novosphingobium sp.]